MRRLHVDLQELTSAFEDSSDELNYYLDLETGEVELVTEDARLDLETFDEAEEGEEFSEEEPLLADEQGLPDWRQEALAVARAVEEGFGTRYIAIPKPDSHEGYRDMEWFIATVSDPRLQERLYRAINGRGAFRYFKDVLYDYPKERERWFAFRDERLRRRVLQWLEDEEIELIE